jgi:UDP-3-O-[3-hydroxymyristoyl] glucosamine N-acyltransferase
VTESKQGGKSASGEGVRTLTASDIAEIVGGKVTGNGDAAVRALAPLDRATDADLSFLANARYAPMYERTRASAVLIAPEFADLATTAAARIVVDRPHDAMLAVLPRLYRAPVREPGVHATARLGRGVSLGDAVTIGPYAVIGDGAVIGDRSWIDAHVVVGAGVVVGSDSRIFPSATLYSGTTVGHRVVVHAGVRLGSDGFGYVFRNGIHEKIPHVGRCIIEDDVEIGANTTIDRGSVDDTVIGAGTKIDNLVQVAHNVRIGRLCVIVAQVGIAGSARVEDGVVIGGQAGLAGHITIGSRAQIAGQAGVFGNVPPNETWSGYPARPHRQSLRATAAVVRLVDIIKKLERMVERE